MIEIRWQESDRAIASSTSSNSTSTASDPTSTASETAVFHPESSALSTGVKAAIGVSVPIAIAMVAALLFFWRKRRAPSVASGHEKQGISPREIQGTPLIELPSKTLVDKPAELSSSSEARHELA